MSDEPVWLSSPDRDEVVDLLRNVEGIGVQIELLPPVDAPDPSMPRFQARIVQLRA